MAPVTLALEQGQVAILFLEALPIYITMPHLVLIDWIVSEKNAINNAHTETVAQYLSSRVG
jgi:hypothetical protein